MTTGDDCGTSGAARAEWRPWIFVAAVSVVVVIVNATSNILELQRAGLEFHWWEPVTWEVSSALIIVALAPLIGRAVQRWPPGRDNWIRPGLIHLALTVPFSLIHVGAIYVMRNGVYWLMQDHYGFFDDGVGLVLVYEWRKDLLSYATIAAVYWVFDYIAASTGPAITAVNSGSNSTFTYDGLLDLFHTLPIQYRDRAAWFCRSLAFSAILKLKDSTNQPILYAGSIPGTLLGKKVWLTEHAPAVAQNAYPLLFGDVSYYVIAERTDMRLQRLDERFAPNVGFLPTARLGGGVIRTAPFRAQKISA